ncbi:MAG: hypothetical protein V1904_12985 [Bacteroidota bacterium]
MKTKNKNKKRENAPVRLIGDKLTNYELLRLRGGEDPPPPPPPPPPLPKG